MNFTGRLSLLLLVFTSAFLFGTAKTTRADWTNNPNFPPCSIAFTGTGTITATASTSVTGANITSLLRDTVVVTTTPATPATSVSYSWTPTADSRFTAIVTKDGNSSACSATYSLTLPSCTPTTSTGTSYSTCTRKTGAAANSCSSVSGTRTATYTGANCATATATVDCQMTCTSPATCVNDVCIPPCNTGQVNCGAWSPTTDYTCSLSQSRICDHDALTGGGSCTTTAYTETRTIDTTCTTHTGYSCNTGNECIPPAPAASFSAICSTTSTYTITISWTASNVTYADLSDKTTDAERNINYSNKAVTGTSTQAAAEFTTHVGTGVTSLNAGTTYYARIWDSVRNKNSDWASFTVPVCCNTCADNICTTGTDCTGGLPGTCTTSGANCTPVTMGCVPNPPKNLSFKQKM